MFRRLGIETFDKLGVNRLLTPRYAGRGVAIMLHSVVESEETPAVPGMAIDAPFLSSTIAEIRRLGWSTIPAHETVDALSDRSERFVVFTLDDGYRDNLTVAADVFQSHDCPFAVYPALSYVDGATNGIDPSQPVSWDMAVVGYAIGRGPAFTVTVGPAQLSLDTSSVAARGHAAGQLVTAVENHPDGRAVALEEMVAALDADLGDIVATTYLSWDELRSLCGAHGAQIGCHADTHSRLRDMTDEAVRREIMEARSTLQRQLGADVKTIAYPFGSRWDVGAREFACAQEAGFTVGFTTVQSNLLVQHRQQPMALPRLGLTMWPQYRSLAFVRGLVRGGFHFTKNRGRTLILNEPYG